MGIHVRGPVRGTGHKRFVDVNFSIVIPSTEAAEHPQIKKFVDLVDSTVGDGALTFSDTQSRPFMKYWKNLVINKHIVDKNDFLCTFLGTDLVETYGADHTGKLVSERGTIEVQQYLMRLNFAALNNTGPIYASGKVFWGNKHYKIWHQARMALKHGSTKDGTLGFIVFE